MTHLNATDRFEQHSRNAIGHKHCEPARHLFQFGAGSLMRLNP
jgi:hypothetical protein